MRMRAIIGALCQASKDKDKDNERDSGQDIRG